MDAVCARCGLVIVDKPGDVCPGCAENMNLDALKYAGISVSGENVPVTDVSDGTMDMVPPAGSQPNPATSDTRPAMAEDAADPAPHPKQGSAASPVSIHEKGVAKNVVLDIDDRGTMSKWFSALFHGSNFSFDPDITTFQLYQDAGGRTLNSSGNLADQVIVYGKIKAGAISENNIVEVFGRRNNDNTIIAQRIINIDTGTEAKPSLSLSHDIVLVSTIGLAILMIIILGSIGVSGLVSLGLFILFIIFLPWILWFVLYLLILSRLID